MAIQYNRFGQPVNVDMGLGQNTNQEIIEQDTWRTNMNPQNAWGNYGINALRSPHLNQNQTSFPNPADISGQVGEYGVKPGQGNVDMISPQKKGFNFPGIIGLIQNMFQGAGDKLGMTQVSDADRAANKEFMQEQGIGRDSTTGRMYGGNWNEASQDFAGKNAPGTSAWGSANFGEMAQKWDEEYGDMDYRTPKMIAKQKRIKAQAIEYAQKLQADKIAADAAKAASATGGPDMSIRGWDPQQAAPQRPDRPGGFTDPGKGSYGPWSAQGGYMTGHTRSRYNRGGRVGILAAF